MRASLGPFGGRSQSQAGTSLHLQKLPLSSCKQDAQKASRVAAVGCFQADLSNSWRLKAGPKVRLRRSLGSVHGTTLRREWGGVSFALLQMERSHGAGLLLKHAKRGLASIKLAQVVQFRWPHKTCLYGGMLPMLDLTTVKRFLSCFNERTGKLSFKCSKTVLFSAERLCT